MRRTFDRLLRAVLVFAGIPASVVLAQAPQPAAVLFENVRVFDGASARLSPPSSVLVVGNTIKTISTAQIAPPAGTQLTTIDGKGRVLMPGLIDAHAHIISQTSGHADHRSAIEPPLNIGGQPDLFVKFGHAMVADGVPEVLKAARDALRQGASQIKIPVGGGTGSEADPLDVVEYSPEEIRAAVQAASDWHTYVAAHVYNSDGIRRAIENGVRCIEHGNLVDEPTLKLIKEKGIWLSPQVSQARGKSRADYERWRHLQEYPERKCGVHKEIGQAISRARS